MGTQEKVLNEIKELKDLIAKIIGTSNLEPNHQFSEEALEKATKEYQKLCVERGEWVEASDISDYIKSAPYGAGKFIIEEFGFWNYFKRGKQYFFNKRDLISLGKELKERRVDLGVYIAYKQDQLNFEKYVNSILEHNPGKSKKPFKVPLDLVDITTTPPKMPSPDLLNSELEALKNEFFEYKLGEYIDIHKGSYAMTKEIYWFKRYIDPTIRKRMKRWMEEFNLVNRLIQEVTKKKAKFIPVPEEEMIRL